MKRRILVQSTTRGASAQQVRRCVIALGASQASAVDPSHAWLSRRDRLKPLLNEIASRCEWAFETPRARASVKLSPQRLAARVAGLRLCFRDPTSSKNVERVSLNIVDDGRCKQVERKAA